MLAYHTLDFLAVGRSQEVHVITSEGGDDTCFETYLEVVTSSGKKSYVFVNIMEPESTLFSYIDKNIHVRPTREGKVDPAPTLEDLHEELSYDEEA